MRFLVYDDKPPRSGPVSSVVGAADVQQERRRVHRQVLCALTRLLPNADQQAAVS